MLICAYTSDRTVSAGRSNPSVISTSVGSWRCGLSSPGVEREMQRFQDVNKFFELTIGLLDLSATFRHGIHRPSDREAICLINSFCTLKKDAR